MHVTNATPQMQAFNSPIWLALEDYALQHAREDDMRISVFTGPVLTDDDPNVRRPYPGSRFWKVSPSFTTKPANCAQPATR